MCDFKEKLKCILKEDQIRLQEPMSRHTTFKVGGPADYFVEPDQAEQIAAVIDLCRNENVCWYILGNGSNLLVGDKGYRGVILSIGKPWSTISVNGDTITAGAGALLTAVARQAYQNSLTGLEFASGIPGTVGGAVVMNAGAYGAELCDVLRDVTVLTKDGQVKTIPASDMELGYRTSCVLKEGYTVLRATFLLKNGNADEIKKYMDELAEKRRTKQPLEYPSAGSTFKRPEGYFAGKLIEDAGFRGFQVGGAQVSEKHCGFVVNREDATAADIINLCDQVKKEVKAQFGVELELEVKLLGEFE